MLEFCLDSWSAWSESKTKPSEWISWANGQSFDPASQPIDLSALPAMKRRRLSQLSKIAYSTAVDIHQAAANKPICIFATQHGELQRTIKIIKDMVADQSVSPTDFSLSVHSTALGLFSLFTENTKPATTVVAGEDTFGYALVEASNYLSRFPSESVLVVYFDEPVPQELSEFEDNTTEAFGIALLLSAGQEEKIEFSRRQYDDALPRGDRRNLGEDFLMSYLSGDTCGEGRTQKMVWNWSRQQ